MFMDRGKWYWEVNVDGATVGECYVGVSGDRFQAITGSYIGGSQEAWGMVNSSGTALSWQHNAGDNPFTDTGTMQAGDYVMNAYDADTGKLWWGLNGSWLDSGDPAAGTGEHVTTDRVVAPAVSAYSVGETLRLRTEEGDFEGTMPAGFKALNVNNLTDADDAPIPKGSDYFDVVTWTGDASNPRTFTGLDFAPDMIWIKARAGGTSNHILADTLRGVDKVLFPYDSSTEQTDTAAGDVSAFTADGFSVDDNSSDTNVNDAAFTYVAWCWKMDTEAGFDIQQYVGTGSAHAESHDLGVAPDIMFVKNRDTTATAWMTQMSDQLLSAAPSLPVTDPETDYLALHTNAARADLSTGWNDTAPDASNFTVGTLDDSNKLNDNFMAYLWTNIAGFSKQGSYVGNGNVEGPFVWTGFRPKYIMFKRDDANGNWVILDQDRADVAGKNPNDQYLLADTSAAEASGAYSTDFLANGFKIRSTNAATNAASGEYDYIAFAEHPFKYARAF
jgi:hypothetical protein